MAKKRILNSSFRAAALMIILAVCLAFGTASTKQVAADSVWGSGTLSEAELWALIGQMTVAEANTFLHGSNTTQTPCANDYVSPWVQGCQGEAGRIPGVPRLGIPPLRLSDGPAGVRLGHVETSMPAPIGLTASFNREMAYLFASTVGRGLKATNQDVWLAPMMNMINMPTAGRNFETLGEDVYLSGELAVPLVNGVQSTGIIAQIKHFVDNDFENGRNSTSVLIDERTQHEAELQPFEKAAKAGAGSVMCSYNRINHVYSCSSEETLKGILKGLWNWDGFVTSDWGATHRPQDLMKGLDMEQSGSNNLGSNSQQTSGVLVYINNGTGSPAVPLSNDFPAEIAYTSAEWKAAQDEAVFRILTQMNKAGLLEGTQFGSMANGCDPANAVDCTPYVPPRPDLQVIQPEEFAAAQLIAEQSAVMLKNEGLLPLTCADFAGNGVVVMGPTATAAYTGGGGSAHVRPYDPVISPFEAIKTAAMAKCGPGVNISYVPGYDLDGVLLPSSALKAPDPAEGYPNWTLKPEDDVFANQPGLLRQQIITASVSSGFQPILYTGADAAPDQLDPVIDYTGANTLPVNTAWRWSGTFTAPADGSWRLTIFVANTSGAQLFVDGLTTSNPTTRRINRSGFPVFPTDSVASQGQTSKGHDPASLFGTLQSGWTTTLTAGQQLHLDLRIYTGATTPAKVQLRWTPPTNQDDQIALAASAAAAANKVVDFVYDEGTEGSDRGGNAIANGLYVPGYQSQVVDAVSAANPNTIIVLNTGDPVWLPFVDEVKSILQMWYPGQMGGPATANVLLGNVNPGGKLPETFPDVNAPIGQRFPQDTQPAACADNTANYGIASSGPGNSNPSRQIPTPGECPMYPGIYEEGFLWDVDPALNQLHSYRTINYSDQVFAGFQGHGVFQGYKWYDLNDYAPLYPFGHGLSYTEFEYSGLAVQPAGDGFDVTFTVKNIGAVAGDEVPQVYVGAPLNPPVSMVEKGLAAFERITLNPGEAKTVTMHIGERELSYWDVNVHDWVKVGGYRPIYVGSSSRDIRLTNWSSFFPPVYAGTPNVVKAGSAVPIKFSLFGNYGLDIFNAGNPVLQQVDCTTGDPIGMPIPAVSKPGLKYEPGADTYNFVMKTDKSMAGTCAQLQVQVDYYNVYTADFIFNK